MIVIEKYGGEYTLICDYFPQLPNVIEILTKNEDLKSFVLLDYVSSNANFFEVIDGVNYKKFASRSYIVDGKDLKVISKDNIFSGEIMLCSEPFKSLSSKSSLNQEYLPWEYKVKITQDKVIFTFRKYDYIALILAFIIINRISSKFDEISVSSLGLALDELIPNSSRVEIEFVEFGKLILPHKIVISMKVSYDDGTRFYSIYLSKGKWTVKSNNLRKGATNFLHYLFLIVFYFIKNRLSELKYNSIFSKFLSTEFFTFLKNFSRLAVVRIGFYTFLVVIGIFVVLKLFDFVFWIIVFIFVLIFWFYRKFFISFHLKRR